MLLIEVTHEEGDLYHLFSGELELDQKLTGLTSIRDTIDTHLLEKNIDRKSVRVLFSRKA